VFNVWIAINAQITETLARFVTKIHKDLPE
jgi:hypothetical protein